MKPAKVAPDRSLGPAHAVVPAVLIEVGMKARDSRNSAPQYVSQRAEPQGCLGGDMHEVGLEAIDGLSNFSKGGQWKVQLFIEREIEGPNQVVVVSLGRLTIIGMDELDLIAL